MMKLSNPNMPTSRGEASALSSLLEGVAQSAVDAIIAVNGDHKIIVFNRVAEQMFGVAREDALGQSIFRFIPEQFLAGHDAHIDRCRQTGVTSHTTGRLGATRGLRADGVAFPIEASVSYTRVSGEHLSTFILRDIAQRRSDEEAWHLLARDVDHGAKSTLAVARTLVNLTEEPSHEAFRVSFQSRIDALARAQNLLAENRWRGCDLGRIVEVELEAHQGRGHITTRGPVVQLRPSSAQSLSLMLHELATHAATYGALSSYSGHVIVTWRCLADDRVELRWEELGGPPVGTPDHRASTMASLSTIGIQQLEAEIAAEWPSAGFRFSATLPRDAIRPARFRQTHQTAAAGPSHASTHSRKRRLILVEDEIIVALELAGEFRASGWDVIGPATSVEEAFALLERGPQLDAAVLDVNLNGEMIHPFADALRSRGIPLVFCTGQENPDVTRLARRAPVIQKPATARTILETLKTARGGFVVAIPPQSAARHGAAG